MSSIRKSLTTAASVALALAGTFGASAAHAGNVQWSVGVQLPHMVTVVGNGPAYHAPPPVYYAPPPVVYRPAPVYYPAPQVRYDGWGPRHVHGHGDRYPQHYRDHDGRRDERRDHDGRRDERRDHDGRGDRDAGGFEHGNGRHDGPRR